MLNRRQLLLSVWVAPSVAVISLPIHAQTSCSAQQIAGLWRISSTSSTFDIQLNADGTTDEQYVWQVNNNRIRLEDELIADAPVYSGDLNGACNAFDGTVQFFTVPIIKTEAYTAIKIG